MNNGLCAINKGNNGSQKITEREKIPSAWKPRDRENTLK